MCPASEEKISQPGARVLYGREDAVCDAIRLLGKYLVGMCAVSCQSRTLALRNFPRLMAILSDGHERRDHRSGRRVRLGWTTAMRPARRSRQPGLHERSDLLQMRPCASRLTLQLTPVASKTRCHPRLSTGRSLTLWLSHATANDHKNQSLKVQLRRNAILRLWIFYARNKPHSEAK